MPAPRAPGLNALSAVVREVTFVGEMHRYVLETESGALVTLKQQHRHGIRTPAMSETVVIEWCVEDTRVI